MKVWKLCSGPGCSATFQCVQPMSFKSVPLNGIQGIQRNDILEILANLGDQHAALGVSWDGCEHPTSSFVLAFNGQEKIRLNRLSFLFLLRGVRRC